MSVLSSVKKFFARLKRKPQRMSPRRMRIVSRHGVFYPQEQFSDGNWYFLTYVVDGEQVFRSFVERADAVQYCDECSNGPRIGKVVWESQ